MNFNLVEQIIYLFLKKINSEDNFISRDAFPFKDFEVLIQGKKWGRVANHDFYTKNPNLITNYRFSSCRDHNGRSTSFLFE